MGGGGGDPKGLYSTLGVAVSATPDEIRKAYRRLALRWHPDKNQNNPEATAQFQKISAAYEVLSDEGKRDLYNSTGCINQDEFDESQGFDHAADFFAAFFGSADAEDLDMDEQAFLDELLRMAGPSAFRRRGRGGGRRRKGRAGARGGGAPSAASSSARASARQQEAEFEAFFRGAAMPSASAGMTCPAGHTMKKRKADADYRCDVCGKTIPEGKKMYDCRKCDFSACLKCQKAYEEELEGNLEPDAMDEELLEEIFEGLCADHIQPERRGRRLMFRSAIDGKVFASQAEAEEHLKANHREELMEMAREAVQEFAGEAEGLGGMPGGMEEFMMASMCEEMLGGGLMGGMGMPMGGGGGKRRSGRRR